MTTPMRPAWAKDSLMVRVDRTASLAVLTPQWAFDGATGRGVRVAVIDSGIDADHPMLEGSVDAAGAVDFAVGADGEVIAIHGPHGDVFGHGTACAGIIHVLAPEATITSVRVLGPNLSGKAAAFHAGLAWAVEEGFDVINLSLGTGKKEWALAFHDVCDRAYFGNSFVVTAANNVNRPSYPSLFASVASVACNTSTDALRFHSNPDPPTEFLARGIDVEVPWLDGGTTVTTGNSFAAPHIAGFAALIKSKHPELRPFHLKAALWATSANVRESAAPEPAGRRSTTMFSPPTSPLSSTPSTRGTVPARGTASTPVRHRSAGTDGAEPGRTERCVDTPDPVSATSLLLGDPVGIAGDAPLRLATRAGSEPLLLVHDLRAMVAAPDAADPVSTAVLDAVRDAVRGAPGGTGLAAIEGIDDAGGPLVLLGSQRPRSMVAARNPRRDVVDLVRALAVGHTSGGLHGDLSPGWLLVDMDGELRLYGIGLASVMLSAGAASRGVDHRRLRYHAPERIGGAAPSTASDVYGFAMVASELLTGALPFPEVDALGAFVRQRTATDPGPVASLGDVPSRWADVLQHALDRIPAARPSAAEVVEALTSAEPTNPATSRDRWFRRR